jgi:hypothetical protein
MEPDGASAALTRYVTDPTVASERGVETALALLRRIDPAAAESAKARRPASDR